MNKKEPFIQKQRENVLRGTYAKCYHTSCLSRRLCSSSRCRGVAHRIKVSSSIANPPFPACTQPRTKPPPARILRAPCTSWDRPKLKPSPRLTSCRRPMVRGHITAHRFNRWPASQQAHRPAAGWAMYHLTSVKPLLAHLTTRRLPLAHLTSYRLPFAHLSVPFPCRRSASHPPT